VDEIQFLPKSTTTISGDYLVLFEKFLDMLDDLDDVQNVYHGAELFWRATTFSNSLCLIDLLAVSFVKPSDFIFTCLANMDSGRLIHLLPILRLKTQQMVILPHRKLIIITLLTRI